MSNLSGLLRLNRFGFPVWGWATLLVVLVSAAPDGGAPGSRELGSAFDPATVSVAVGPQPPRVVAVAQSDQTLPPAFPAGDAAAFAPFWMASPHDVVGGVAGGSLLAHRPPAAGDPRSINRAHGARAPPRA